MTPHCIGTPISWLRLEQYLLDELPHGTRREVERHLGACAVCKRCLELALHSHGSVPISQPRRVTRRSWRNRWPLLLSAAALVASLLLFYRLPAGEQRETTPPARVAIKGGELALQLVRNRGGRQNPEPERFAPGDHFRVLVTCPPGEDRVAELVIFQAGARYFPLERAELACGNRVALPGAFRLTTAAAVAVCVVLDPPARSALTAGEPAALPAPHVCLALDPQ